MSSSRTQTTYSNGDAESPPHRVDNRARERSHLFVSVILNSDGGSAPALIRNLSQSGALVECPVVPPAGTRVRICRGDLEVGGVVIWQNGRRAGLKFDSSIAINDWLPNATRNHQALVDKMVHEVRTNAAGPRTAIPPDAQPVWTAGKIASLVEQVAEEFSRDQRIVAEHSDKLQQLEIAVQHIRQLR